MKRFSVSVIGGGGDIAPWLDTGFVEFAPGDDETGRPLRPDTLYLAPDEKGWAEAASVLWPKVIVLAAPVPVLPAELSEAYRLYSWRADSFAFAIASRLEAQLAEPFWPAYGPLTQPVAVKAVADVVYRHLLVDVFRETAEWCGHTFSVVTSL
jgi:hypothetical protein